MKDAKGHGSNGRGAGVQPYASHQDKINSIVRGFGDNPYTVDSVTGRSPQEGYMVGGGGRYLGGWTDEKTGQRYVERSTRVNPRMEALAKSLGRRRNQISIYDLKGQREIKTGGTGVYPKN